MEMFEIGKAAPWLNLSKEGAYFDLDGSGFLLVYNYNSPTPGEIAAFQAGTACEFRFVRVGGVLFLLSKLGALPWNDSPFALQLARTPSLPDVPEGKGYAVTLLLLDNKTQIVRGLRLVGLGTQFSRKLRAEISEDVGKPMLREEYLARVAAVQSMYTTSALVSFASDRYKIN